MPAGLEQFRVLPDRRPEVGRRRLLSWPTWAIAGRRASAARARTIGWKLPLLIKTVLGDRRRAGCRRSTQAPSRRRRRMRARTRGTRRGPVVRRETTAGPGPTRRRPAGTGRCPPGRSGWRPTIALARNRLRLRATCGIDDRWVAADRFQRGGHGQVGGDRGGRAAGGHERAACPTETPFAEMSARPSFGCRTGGSTPARRIASGPGRTSPSNSARPPMPAATSPIAAMCIRSDAPTEPISGTTGCTPALSIATSVSATAGLCPGPPVASPRRGRTSPLGQRASAVAAPIAPTWPSDDAVLVFAQHLDRHPLVAHVAEAGVQAVDQRVAGDQLVDHRAGRGDPLDRLGASGRPARRRRRRRRP